MKHISLRDDEWTDLCAALKFAPDEYRFRARNRRAHAKSTRDVGHHSNDAQNRAELIDQAAADDDAIAQRIDDLLPRMQRLVVEG